MKIDSSHLNFDYFFNKYQNKKFIVQAENTISYNTFRNECVSMAMSLSRYGIKQSDIILIKSQNSIDYLKLIISVFYLGAILCPVDVNINKDKFEEYINYLKPKLIINKNEQLKKFNKKISNQNFIKKNFPNQNYLLMMTSGTTGEPKAMMFSIQNILKSAIYYGKLADYSEQTIVYHVLPMFYMAGILNTFLSPLTKGSSILLGNKFNAESLLNFWDLPKKFSANSIHLTPTIAHSIANFHRDNKEIETYVSNMKDVITTGSILYKNTFDFFNKKFNCRLRSCYGVTEAGGPLTLQAWEDTLREDNNVGFHLNDIKFKLKAKPGSNFKSILVRTPFMMKGYYMKKNKKFQIRLDKNGYLNTMDYGSYDSKNKILFIEGRESEIIKRAGELVSLSYIENIISKYKEVGECSCISLSDKLMGTKIYVFIIFKKKINIYNQITLLKIKLKKDLKQIEIPEKIIPIQEMPRGSSGKIIKKKLLEIYC